MFEIFNLLERKEEFGYVKKMETFLKYLKNQAKLKLLLLKITVFLKKVELLKQLQFKIKNLNLINHLEFLKEK